MHEIDKTVFVRCNSHRARQYLDREIGKTQSYYSWHRHCTGGFQKIPAHLLGVARTIKGITLVHKTDDLRMCISW